ncbi:CocE/NonD family hydrolase [Roseateles asaccharophilus]|uniref:Acyl esterase n=1 Tax=Roseateles asaccharophilus TaxID=582607 RepID=A0ABU2AC13_9BURK|nr:CocE/NonD family hydrolase [Roseateles asaccharophilus]MDR7334032.1 putative acyl esterase [Roseateles asaccharophilus]
MNLALQGWRRRAARGFAVAAGLLALAGAQAATLACRAPTPLEAATFTTPLALPGVVSPRDGTCFIRGLKVTRPDGVRLAANVFLPAGASSGSAPAQYPAVIFISSWASAEFFEYLGQQHRMARDGYIAVAYTTRGFWDSDGVIGVAGPLDVADVSGVLDWTLANTPTDPARVGAAGISYGAGLSLLALGKEPRLKTAVALSGWATLIDQMYANQVPNPTWLNILQLSGQVTGRLDPIVAEYNAAIQNPDTPAAKLAEIAAWGWPRSPRSAVEAINARGAPVFIGKNWQDDMFSPNSTLAMFNALTVPKKLLLQPGIHASAELPGALLDIANPVWDEAHRWMDRWLRGRANGIDSEPAISLQPKFKGYRETLSGWPAPELRTLDYQLTPRGALRWELSCLCWRGIAGELKTGQRATSGRDSIGNALDTSATTGPLPVLSPLMESVGLPVINHMPTVLPAFGVRYEGPWLSQPLKVRGVPALKLRVVPSRARGMLVAYLYDVDAAGFGTLITHGARALHTATPGQSQDLSFDLVATGYDVPAGHRLVLVFDTQDHLYGPPVRPGERFDMALDFGAGSPLQLKLQTR